MIELITRMFDGSDFMVRWKCGAFTTTLGLTHIVSDLAIFAAYAAIPIALVYFILQREDVPFVPVFWLFVAFITMCGVSHLVEAAIFWHPWYRFSAVVKLLTALVSWATVIALLPIIPQALALPRLATENEALTAEVEERRATEERLAREVAERQRAESRIMESHADLEAFSDTLLDREERMIRLKAEVNALLFELGREARYQVEDDE